MLFRKGFKTIFHVPIHGIIIFSTAALKYRYILTLQKYPCQFNSGTFFGKYFWEIIRL